MLRPGTCETARLPQKIYRRIRYCLEERLTRVCESPCRASGHLIRSSMQFIEIRPLLSDKELRPEKENALWNKEPRDTKTWIPKASFDAESVHSGGNAGGPGNGLQHGDALAT